MKICFFSDTHGYHQAVQLPPADALVFAGDMGNQGTPIEIASFANWLDEQPHRYKIVIAGNHDWGFAKEATRLFSRDTIKAIGAIYLENEEVILDGIKFWGSPYTPEFCGWAFMKERGEPLRKIWEMIPTDVDVLITHGPPKGYLDKTKDRNFRTYKRNALGEFDHMSTPESTTLSGDSCGCADLADIVSKIKPEIHVFGHIHDSYGKIHNSGVTYINASFMDEHFWPTNAPIVVEVRGRATR